MTNRAKVEQIMKETITYIEAMSDEKFANSLLYINSWYRAVFAICDNQPERAKNAIKAVTGKEKSADFTAEDMKALFEDIQKREDERI